MGGAAFKPSGVRVAIIGLAGAIVAVVLYIVGKAHTPDYTTGLFGQSGLNAIMLKSALATAALGLAVVQVLLALWIYRKLPLAGRAPKPVGMTHRVVGAVLVALTLPIAIHCFLAYGVVLTDARKVIHPAGGAALVHLGAVVLQRLQHSDLTGRTGHSPAERANGPVGPGHPADMPASSCQSASRVCAPPPPLPLPTGRFRVKVGC